MADPAGAATLFDDEIGRSRATDRFALGRRALTLVALGWLSPDTADESLSPYLAAGESEVDRRVRLHAALTARARGLTGDPVWAPVARLFAPVLLPDVFQSADLETVAQLARDTLRRLGSGVPQALFGPWFGDRLDGVAASGAIAMDVATSRGLARLMLNLARLDGASTLFDPACGLGGILAAAHMARPGMHLRGIDSHPFSWAMSRLRLSLLGATFEIDLGDALKDGGEDAFADRVVCDPPLRVYRRPDADPEGDRLRNRRIDGLFLERAADALAPGGRAVVLISQSVLARKPETELRQRLVEAGMVEAVISLPPAASPWTGIDLALVVLHRGVRRHRRIRFIDAAHYALVSGAGRSGVNLDAVAELYNRPPPEAVADVDIDALLDGFGLQPRLYFVRSAPRPTIAALMADARRLSTEAQELRDGMDPLLTRLLRRPGRRN